MSPWLLLLVPLIAVVVLEIAARIYYRVKYLVPFHSRVIGEYPFSEFLEEVDPPLFFRFKKNYSSPLVNLNRFGCRGPQPAPDGEKKRLLVIGESNLFGVKLRKEKHLWSIVLQDLLDQRMPGRWEVINAGNPGYNSDQHWELWRKELKKVKPDILVVAMGGNDTAMVTTKGPKWRPGTAWPLKFVLALERKSRWWQKILNHFCLYFLWRRMSMGPPANNFPLAQGDIPLAACHENIKKNFQALAREARAMGAKVACTVYAPAIEPGMDQKAQRRAAAIQANWHEVLETRTVFDLKLVRYIGEVVSPELDLPLIDFYSVFRRHPRRFEMYFDLVHWNQKGMLVVAQTFLQDIDKLGWWD